MSTLKEIAKRAEVSVATVSRILLRQSKESWPGVAKRAEKIRRIAEELNYRPSAAARAFQSRRNRIIGVMVCWTKQFPVNHIAEYAIIQGLNLALEESTYVPTLVRMNDLTTEGMQSRVFFEQLIDAMVVIGPVSPEICDFVEKTNSCCVWVDSNINRPTGCIRRDELAVGKMAANCLADMDFKKIVWINALAAHDTNTFRHYSQLDRIRGIQAVSRKRQIELVTIDLPLPHRVLELADALDRLLKPEVGIIAYNRSIAETIHVVASDQQKRYGIDYGLVTCDRYVEGLWRWYALSGVEVDYCDIGRQAAQMALAMIQHPEKPCRSRLIKPWWHAGCSALPPAHSSS